MTCDNCGEDLTGKFHFEQDETEACYCRACWQEGILLIFARTETRAWQQIWNTATGILLPSSRITFHRPDGTKAKSGTAPSAFVAFGHNNVEALHKSDIKGVILEEWECRY